MKKLLLYCVSILAMLATSCGPKTTPEDEVRNYGKHFIEKISANEIDSLTATYPDITAVEEYANLDSDTVIVAATETPGQFEVTLADGVTLIVNRADDGSITVDESYGLFAFPADKEELARKTGLWDDNLNDVKLAERMNDDEFFKWVEKKTAAPSKILSLGKYYADPPTGGSAYSGDQTIVNNTSVPVDGSDYVVIYHCAESDGEWRESRPGKPIPANGSVRFKEGGHGAYGNWIEGVKMKLSSKEIKEKFSKPLTGHEYQEYLDSKK